MHTEPPDGPAQILSDLAWSPDGARIAYTRAVTDRRFHSRPSLYTVDANGGEPQLLAREAGDAAWSPDGRRIAFASVRDRNGKLCFEQCSYRTELYVMDADGSDPLRLTRDRGDDESPTWSPDGRRIAFASDRNYPDGEASEIYSIRADGSCLAALTNGAPESVDPSWRATAARASDPGRCGPTGREPLVEVGLPRVLGPDRFPLYWLGERYRALLLSASADGFDNAALFYRDCASFRARGCPAPLQIQETSVCSRSSVLTVVDDRSYRPVRAFVARGRLVVDLGQGDLTVIAGETDVRIFPNARSRRRANRQALAAIRKLRPVGERRPGLPVTGLPRSLLHRLRDAERTHRRAQFAAAVDSLPRIRAVKCR